MRNSWLVIILFIGVNAHAQTTLTSEVIGGGGLFYNDAFSIQSTVGETATQPFSSTYEEGFNVAHVINKDINFNVYSGFTPNDDLINDTWVIDDIASHPTNNITILSKSGQMINSFINYDNTSVVWDGTDASGNQIPEGTYLYVISLTNNQTIRGWVHLSR